MMIFFFAIPIHYVICLAIHFAVNNRLSLLYAVGFPTHTKNQAQYQEIEKILYYFACLPAPSAILEGTETAARDICDHIPYFSWAGKKLSIL